DGSVLRARVHDGEAVIEDLPLGYHAFSVEGSGVPPLDVIVCPDVAWQPPALAEGARWWGVNVQLYALRSRQNWGVGDFSDLARLAELLASQGASFIGLNPLHALFTQRPHEASPYSPSSRNALNVLYLDIEAMAEFQSSREARQQADREEFRLRIEALREADEVDWPGVAALKLPFFELLWQEFRTRHLAPGTARAGQWREFMAAHPHLARHALFEAIQQHLFAQDPSVWGWPAWPAEWQDPDSTAVRGFAAEHEERVGFYAWLQWQADRQLELAQRRARAAGMALGLYRDLAVGANAGGSDVWSRRADYALGLNVGAPPDPLSAAGQDWGLPPLNPHRLAHTRYRGFIEMLRANMRHAGALRLDHVMGLMRLFWTGRHGGTYVRYPLDALMGILALESQRQHCMVIGEDLGNVAPAMRESMREHRVLSYCPLYFERAADGGFRPPAEWRPMALAVVSTHDLPTLAGWWMGDDIEFAATLHPQADDSHHTRQVLDRAQDRARLLIALEREGLLPAGASVHPTALHDAGPVLMRAVHGFLARTPCLLLGVQLEDVLGQRAQINVPGTLESQYPNWRRKLGLVLEDLAVDARLLDLAQVLSARSATAPSGDAGDIGEPGAVRPLLLGEVPAPETALVPQSTYRVQLHAGFTFDDATRIVPYLAALGISHLYASPWQKARAGSTHGYDVVDHNALNPELGDEAAFDRLCSTLSAHDMRQMLDIVPNHMGVLEADNAWWLDVLEHGPGSLHAETFDIDWNPPGPDMAGRVLLPVLGDHYGRVLEAGELTLVFEPEHGSFHVAYWNHRFPVDPRDYAALLQVTPGLPEDERLRLESLRHAFEQLPPREDTSADARATRARDARLHKKSLARRVAAQPALAAAVAAATLAYAGTPGQPQSFDALDALIGRQAWRLAYWRVAGDEINYRRFFDINTLAALRMERESVFEATHRKVLRWLQDGCIAALRIDHPDGLADPRAYFDRLQARQAQMSELAGQPRRAIYLVVEKILAGHEDLPAEWPVHGGTGYRFANLANGLFVDPAGEGAMTRIYTEFIGAPVDFGEVLYEAKQLIMDRALGSDLRWLAVTGPIGAVDREARGDFGQRLAQPRVCEIARAPVSATDAQQRAGQPAQVTAQRAIHDELLGLVQHFAEVDRRTDELCIDARHRALAGRVDEQAVGQV
ncbi:MAG: 4-alpha-glucanotransferase, partial [Lysobacteraceae bacterium]